MKPRLEFVSLVIPIIAVCATAHAQTQGAQAEALFRQGKALMTAGKYADACAAFDASQKLEPNVSTVLNQANCREKNGQLATAWGLYLEAERQTRGASDDAGKQMYSVATDHVGKLEPRLSTLAINVPDEVKVGGLEILRDNEPVDPGAWNKALPVDGGTYKITAHAPGNAVWSATVTIGAERDAKVIDIPKLKAAVINRLQTSVEPKPAAPEAPISTPKESEPAAEEDTTTARPTWLPYAVGGGGLALLATGLVVELAAESTYNDAKTNLDPNKQLSLWHSANNERYVAEALAIGGVAAAGVAVWLYVRDRRAEKAAVAPMASGDRVGIQIVGGF